MAENTKIEWCDHTFNPWIGCTKVSPGCQHCYAETLMDKRLGKVNWGPGNPRQRTAEANWKKVERWNLDAEMEQERYEEYIDDPSCTVVGTPIRPRIFVSSLADWLDPEVPIEWLADLLDLIERCPHLDFLMLTKRPELWRNRLEEAAAEIAKCDWPDEEESDLYLWLRAWIDSRVLPANVWIGTSVEDQKRADDRIPALISIPAKRRFLSCEPLLEDLALRPFNDFSDSGHGVAWLGTGIDWVIVGGESGPDARGCKVRWISSILIQCRQAKVPCFVKQLGRRPLISDSGRGAVYRLPGISDRAGGNLDEWPDHLKVREFPEDQGVRL